MELLRPGHQGLPVAALDEYGVTMGRRAPVAWTSLREVRCITVRPGPRHEHLDAVRVLAFVPHDPQALVARGLLERSARWRHGTPLVLLEPALITPLDRVIDAIGSLSDVPLVRTDDPPGR